MKPPSQKSRTSLLLTVSAAALALISSATAATTGTDNANQAAYEPDDATANDGNPAINTNLWASGDNGSASGSAFQPWVLTIQGSSGFGGYFIGDSKALSGSTGADINVGGESFGMYGGGGDKVAEAVRSFSSALSIGQTFSIDLAVNFRGGFKGIDLRDGSNSTIFNFNIGNVGLGDDYTVQGATTGSGSIGNTYSSNTAFRLSFTQTTAGGGNWTILRSGGTTDSDSGTYTGVAAGFKLYVGGTSGGSENDLISNNLAIVPEPGTAVTAFLGGIILIARRRRKQV